MTTIFKEDVSRFIDVVGFTRVSSLRSISSTTSPFSNGRVNLRTNPGNIIKARLSEYYSFPSSNIPMMDCSNVSHGASPSAYSDAESKCAERYRSELTSKGNLAVSLAQIHKSRENVLGHVQTLCAGVNKDLDRLERSLPGFGTTPNLRRGRATSRSTKSTSRAERIANTLSAKFLEGMFGWKPLFEELDTQINNLSSPKPYKSTIRASGKVVEDFNYRSDWYQESKAITYTVKYSYRVTMVIENPNSYLKTQSGITNYAGAAWDLVPWSFVVNIFTNLGHLVNSIRPIEGVILTDGCKTKRTSVLWNHSKWTSDGKNGFSSGFGYEKTITADPPILSFRLRTPQLNAALVGIAVSLVTQRLTRIARHLDTM